ncbi:MAG TPA: ABC transporter ATP-binding protein [Gammaproteobacteria bacterium]|nr:ABC transporter ATP-binding protein [Gammaproteobacteria bacterium]
MTPPISQPYVRIEGLAKNFGPVAAVDGVTLEIYRAEMFCLLGASGCGKTTLLRMLAGFETPDAGAILIDGQDMSGVPPYERPVNMMFQSYALFPHMTVAENVAFGLKQERARRAEIGARVAEMLALVELGELARRKPDELSGGQKQRVALARARIKRPKLLLLDEPLGSLDKKLREHTQFELKRIQQDLGVTFVVVTHDQEEAMTLATRIGVMDRGRIVQVGTPREIYESPRTRFTAEFIGSVNTFEGRVLESGQGRALIESAELGGIVCVDRAVGAAAGAVVWVTVRPEKIALSCDPAGAAAEAGPAKTPAEVCGGRTNAAAGAVREVAYMGAACVYLVELESGKVVRVTRPNAERGAAAFAPGERVGLSWHESSAVVVRE